MRTHRIAVAAFFFVNGFLYGNWTARLPALQAFLGISHAQLGSLLFTMALGAMLAMPFTGWLTTRLGSDRLTAVAGIACCLLAALMTVSPAYAVAGLVFFSLGIASGSLDVSMNGQAVYVERHYNRPIMSSFHAVFSIGMALGAGVGALFARFGVSLMNQMWIVSLAGLVLVSWAAGRLVATGDAQEQSEGGFRLPTKAILPLGLIAFCCMTGEGAMADWSAIFMHQEVGADAFTSALAVGAFSAAMTTGRVFGDWLTVRLGKYRLLLYSALLSFAGLGTAVLFATAWAGLLGFFMVGLGLATVVPIVYSTAGNTPGVPPSVGIAMATTIGYAGFFIGPPVIGFLADQLGLRIGLAFVLGLFLILLLLTSRMRS